MSPTGQMFIARRRAAQLAGVLVMAFGLLNTACALLKPARTPMRTIAYRSAASQPRTLLVLLPGRTSGPGDFDRQGFTRAVRERGLSVDVVAADAHMGYYYRWTFVERFHEDVILPARRNGYASIWLVGISVGGMGALNYAQYHPEQVAGIVMLAPYLGDRPIIERVKAAGGLRTWEPPARIEPRDYQNATWSWLKGYAVAPAGRPPLVIGIGTRDAFATGNRLVADVLPADRVFVEEGGHDWPAWKAMWARFLDRQTFWK